MSRSFRKDLGLRPQGYRTPSPPCHSVEPLTPATTDGGEIIIHQGGSIGDNLMESKSQDPLSARAQYGGEFEGEAKDAFAAAARVTTSTRRRREQLGDWGNHNAARFEEQVHEERPLKRIKNGQSQPPEACGTDSTAISINDGCLNIRRDEAELLLNFSREACFSVPKPPTLPPRVPFVEAEYSQCQSTPRASFSHSNKQRHLSNPQQPFLSSETMETQGLVTENPRKNSVKSIPGRQQLGDRADSSELPHWATRLGGALGQNNTGKVFDHQQDHDEMKGEEAEFCEFSYHSLQIAQPDRVENFIPKGSNQSGGTLVSDKESRAADTGSERTVANPMDMITSTETTDNRRPSAKMLLSSPRVQKHEEEAPSLCASCKFLRNSLTLETENNATSWINCDGCKSWFHFACAGFRNEREVRSVDKYRCKQCKPKHGATTYVRKSTRAHSAIDYAGLNEGVIKTSDETSEHHYIKPIKDGIIKFNPESFARMRPELVTAEYFERGDGMKEPVVIPAEFNPRPRPIPSPEPVSENQDKHCSEGDMSIDGLLDQSILHENFSSQFEYEIVPDNGQDALDMVMPQDLTVRKVAQLYGPDEKIEVIDVKSQNGEDKKWNLRQWVDYYEKEGSKVVRNVISLEVSQSNLGRLIRRPKIVRDLDLQDAVWPGELKAKGDYPKVQLYCLMSVADCFTDFHIDFGGSSVFYHILKGKKTFFFIPPHEKNLKKYEEWCMSPAQNWTFLGDQTQECFRVDLSAGDTMLIPAGWIHAVWTPEDSLVIGGNFLTRMHYEMQIRVAQIEKVTGVARKFRYPQFQKLLWYSAVNYLEEDPLPESVTESLLAGQVFEREFPRRLNYDAWGKSSKPGAENYHARYYSIAELDGLPELGRYLQRTALIAAGNITDGISTEIRNAVKRSIPKGHGEPLDFVKKFAIWYTWKRGNEPIPHWAYPDYVPEGGAPELTEKKLGTKALRRLEREAALQAWRVAPDRQSSRRRSLPQNIQTDAASDTTVTSEDPRSGDQLQSDTPVVSEMSKDSAPPISDLPSRPSASSSKKRKAENLSSLPAHRRGAACETCRKRRRACTHKAEVAVQMANNGGKDDVLATDSISIKSTFAESARRALGPESSELGAPSEISTSPEAKRVTSPNLDNQAEEAKEYKTESLPIIDAQAIGHNTVVEPEVPMLSSSSPRSDVRPDAPASPSSTRITDNLNVSLMKTPGRAKACKECRKSKRRCVHGEKGRKDPVKIAKSPIPQLTPASRKRKSSIDNVGSSTRKMARNTHTTPDAIMTSPRVAIMGSSGGTLQQIATQVAIQDDTVAVLNVNSDEHTHRAIKIQLDDNLGKAATSTENEITVSTTIIQPIEPSRNINHLHISTEHTSPPEDEVNLIATSPLSEVKFVRLAENYHLLENPIFDQPSASSLVSPPASAHTDAEHTPPASSNQPQFTPVATTSSSCGGPRPSNVVQQRYTPESGSTRRESVSSIGNGRESGSPPVRAPTGRSSTVGTRSTKKEAKPKSRGNSVIEADSESLRLIKELKAEDMGLRKRTRA